MSADIAANEIDKLRNEIARLKGQTNWVCKCGGTDCEGQKENAALRAALVEFRDACWDALSLPVPNVKPYYALVAKHAAFLPHSKFKEAKP